MVKDLGAVSAYAYAVEQGYKGTELEFAKEQASFGANAKQVATDKDTVVKAVNGFDQKVADANNTIDKAKTDSVSAVVAEGAKQVNLVKQEGATQKKVVDDAVNGIVADREQINQNKNDILLLKNGELNDEAIKMNKLEKVSYIKNLIDGTYTENKSFNAYGEIIDSTLNNLWNTKVPIKKGDILYRLNTNDVSTIVPFDNNNRVVGDGRITLSISEKSFSFNTEKWNNVAYVKIAERKKIMENQVWSTKEVQTFIPYGESFYDFSKNPMYKDIIEIISRVPKTGRIPLFTWIDDDTVPYKIDSIKNTCDELGIKCTFACITSKFTTEPTLKDKLAQYQNEGFDIVSHSNSHGRWYKSISGQPIFTEKECIEDLILSFKELRKNDIFTKNFVIPGDPMNLPGHENLWELCKGYCDCIVGNTGSNNITTDSRFNIKRYFIDKKAHDLNYYKNLMNTAFEKGEWFIMGSHTADKDAFDVILAKEIMQYAIEKGFKICTLTQGYKIRESAYKWYEMF